MLPAKYAKERKKWKKNFEQTGVRLFENLFRVLSRATNFLRLIHFGGPLQCARMKIFLAIGVWCVMGAFIGAGVLLSLKGNFWLLGASMLGFVFAVGKIGCSQH